MIINVTSFLLLISIQYWFVCVTERKMKAKLPSFWRPILYTINFVSFQHLLMVTQDMAQGMHLEGRPNIIMNKQRKKKVTVQQRLIRATRKPRRKSHLKRGHEMYKNTLRQPGWQRVQPNGILTPALVQSLSPSLRVISQTLAQLTLR